MLQEKTESVLGGQSEQAEEAGAIQTHLQDERRTISKDSDARNG